MCSTPLRAGSARLLRPVLQTPARPVSFHRWARKKNISLNPGIDVSPPGPWDAFTQTDGRIVTGANPASAHVTAVAAVEAYNKL